MIEAEIKVSRDNISRMVNWCNKNIGTQANSRDTVDHEHPWHWSRSFFDPIFYFAKESDAMWFKLVWA